ncbi:MAG: hypothetical protein M3Y08_17655 [Fibrobacterota bacterium]|nr:hypothetical protein [Fibrobacterota bacterium]
MPGLWLAARSLQKEYGVPRLRIPYESLRRSVFYRFPFGLALQSLARMRLGGNAPCFLGFLTSTRFTLEGNWHGLEEVIRRPETAFELMVHPALPPMPSPPGWPVPWDSTVGESQERELAELRLLSGFFGSRRNPGVT